MRRLHGLFFICLAFTYYSLPAHCIWQRREGGERRAVHRRLYVFPCRPRERRTARGDLAGSRWREAPAMIAGRFSSFWFPERKQKEDPILYSTTSTIRYPLKNVPLFGVYTYWPNQVTQVKGGLFKTRFIIRPSMCSSVFGPQLRNEIRWSVNA